MNQPNQDKTPGDVIVEKGAAFAVGFDTTRTWATGVQVFVNGDFTMLVFREQLLAQDDSGAADFLMRNVGSIVMPTAVMRELYQLAGPLLGVANADQQ